MRADCPFQGLSLDDPDDGLLGWADFAISRRIG
jgi:hypothetical protein